MVQLDEVLNYKRSINVVFIFMLSIFSFSTLFFYVDIHNKLQIMVNHHWKNSGESNHHLKNSGKSKTLNQNEGDSTGPGSISYSLTEATSMGYDQLRFRIFENNLHLTNFIHWKVSKILQRTNLLNDEETQSELQTLIAGFHEYMRFSIRDIESLQEVDALKNWRKQENENFKDVIRRRLDSLQNPQDFNNAKKLLCDLKDKNGYCAFISWVTQCMCAAYASKRTMVVPSRPFHPYFNWSTVFIPVFKQYELGENISVSYWPGNEDSQVIIFNGSYTPFPCRPLLIPNEFSSTLSLTNPLPTGMMSAQLFQYMWRPRPEIKKIMLQWERDIAFENPVVGMHIRRTDKITFNEANFYPLEDYMFHAEQFFKNYELDHSLQRRQIYIATDDVSVFHEVATKYPHYKVLNNESIAKTATEPGERRNENSLHGLFKDIHILTLTDLVICDMTSNVCRLLYMLRLSNNINDVFKFRPVGAFYNDEWFLSYFKAIFSHHPSNSWELKFQVNDTIQIQWNGYQHNGSTFGFNTRTRKYGIFPATKVVPDYSSYDSPTYPQVQVSGEKSTDGS